MRRLRYARLACRAMLVCALTLRADDTRAQGAQAMSGQAGFQSITSAAGLVYVSGVTPRSEVLAGDIAAQLGDVLRQIDEKLTAQGSSLARAVSLQIQLREASDFAAMNAAYAPFFKADPPARTTIVSPPETPRARVEISAIAAAAGASRETVRPAGWAASPNPYSYGVKTGDLVFLSGLVPRDGRTNTVVAGDLAAQADVIFQNAADILEAAGLGLTDVVNAKVFVTDVALVASMNEAYRKHMPTPRPSRATAIAALMNPQYQVEMTFVASAGKKVVDRPGSEPQPDATLQQGIALGSRVFVSGMLGADFTASVDAQTQSIVERLTAVLTAAGYDWSHVREATLYVTDAAHAAPARAAFRKAIGRDLPAGATLVTGLVVGEADVEIMVSAAKP
ncbi:MAG TPA: Rid family hydrolase [Luteitalea sp.]|nr:Rid family hydrolase [Luteitalea sp.]